MIEIKDIECGKHDVNGNLYFNDDEIKINVVDALEIAYTLVDWAGLDYSILDKVECKVISEMEIPEEIDYMAEMEDLRYEDNLSFRLLEGGKDNV